MLGLYAAPSFHFMLVHLSLQVQYYRASHILDYYNSAQVFQRYKGTSEAKNVHCSVKAFSVCVSARHVTSEQLNFGMSIRILQVPMLCMYLSVSIHARARWICLSGGIYKEQTCRQLSLLTIPSSTFKGVLLHIPD